MLVNRNRCLWDPLGNPTVLFKFLHNKLKKTHANEKKYSWILRGSPFFITWISSRGRLANYLLTLPPSSAGLWGNPWWNVGGIKQPNGVFDDNMKSCFFHVHFISFGLEINLIAKSSLGWAWNHSAPFTISGLFFELIFRSFIIKQQQGLNFLSCSFEYVLIPEHKWKMNGGFQKPAQVNNNIENTIGVFLLYGVSIFWIVFSFLIILIKFRVNFDLFRILIVFWEKPTAD